ncbi:hypothetical protein PPERSA_11770 [Pseudocohnilembus persalinus]|uniref:Uncharacterized protein n=1 Tax=Pseudocohnilembus persalinus TaxID=266149 RepID=A0A0V0QGK7_PSEPJ|nr:hypothetical protein PPERSA_11770 [Pseudocohnilembus persalinus]|eukprot:KRX01323.1 hypothetical protein PPERSA_11770 [Pseudocohnilembus persalinus]
MANNNNSQISTNINNSYNSVTQSPQLSNMQKHSSQILPKKINLKESSNYQTQNEEVYKYDDIQKNILQENESVSDYNKCTNQGHLNRHELQSIQETNKKKKIVLNSYLSQKKILPNTMQNNSDNTEKKSCRQDNQDLFIPNQRFSNLNSISLEPWQSEQDQQLINIQDNQYSSFNSSLQIDLLEKLN